MILCLDGEDRHGGLSLQVVLSFIMLPKWHGRDNPLWLSCIRTGIGAAIIRTGTGVCPYIEGVALSPLAFRFSPFASRLLPFASRLLPFAFRLSPFAFRLSPFASRLLYLSSAV